MSVDLPEPFEPTIKVVGDLPISISVNALPVDKKLRHLTFSNTIIDYLPQHTIFSYHLLFLFCLQ